MLSGREWLEPALLLGLCAFAGALLAVVELIQAFGKWIGRYWLNRYVAAVLLLNVATACLVYLFLRYALGVTSNLWLPVITGLTFPTILRSRFTFYRPLGAAKDSLDRESFSLAIDRFYRDLQNLCYAEVNSQIAASRRVLLDRIRRCLSADKVREVLEDHIASEPIAQMRQEHADTLRDIEAIPGADERHRRLAVLLMEIMPHHRVKELLRGCK